MAEVCARKEARGKEVRFHIRAHSSLWEIHSANNNIRYNGYFVDIFKAPEPELILWQNYNVSKESRTYRRIGVAIVGLFLLGLCLTAVILDQYFTDQTDK